MLKAMAGRWPALALCVFGLAGGARAQTTDGYHAIQVLPVVVDTASFTQRFSFRNPGADAITLGITYYPADGTAQASPLTCNNLPVSAQGDASAASLKALCPGLAAGSNFGTLVMRSNSTRLFSVYTRVSNAQGAGFSIEGFAPHNFNSAVSAVTGLRRLAATAGSPAYQSNCFVGNLARFTPIKSPPSIDVVVSLVKDGAQLGSTQVSLPPGRLVRLLDVFAAAGVPAGDHDNVTALFTPTTGTQPAVLGFCTVQDNTSFGADFRIAKTEQGLGFLTGWQDYDKVRDLVVSSDYPFSGELSARAFSIPAGATRNVHTLYFRHPDVVSCEILDAGTNQVAAPAYGLEMRLLTLLTGNTSWDVIAGGNNVVAFSDLYLGDKIDVGNGLNTRYALEVESNGQNEASNRPYKLHCVSGSGHTLGERALSGAPVVF